MQTILATNDTTADEHRSTEVTIPAAPTENGGRNAEENTSNVETPVELPERHLNQVRDEVEQFVSPCFVHSDRGKINYCHITMQIGQQSQTTTEKENVPPRSLKETSNISKSLFNNDKSAKAAAACNKTYITPQQLLKRRSNRKRQQQVRNCHFAFANMYSP